MSSHRGKNSSLNDTSYGVDVFFGTLGKQVRKTIAIVNCTQHGTSSGEKEFRFILHHRHLMNAQAHLASKLKSC